MLTEAGESDRTESCGTFTHLEEKAIIWLYIWCIMSEVSQTPIFAVLLSYDVPGDARSIAVRVCHLVFGRGDGPDRTPPPYILRPGVVWVGQSVLLLPPGLAEELASKLRALGAGVSTTPVRIEPAALESFRRRDALKAASTGVPP